MDKLNWDNITFPVKIQDIKKFEKLNSDEFQLYK